MLAILGFVPNFSLRIDNENLRFVHSCSLRLTPPSLSHNVALRIRRSIAKPPNERVLRRKRIGDRQQHRDFELLRLSPHHLAN